MWEEGKRHCGALSYLCTVQDTDCAVSWEWHSCTCGSWQPLKDSLFTQLNGSAAQRSGAGDLSSWTLPRCTLTSKLFRNTKGYYEEKYSVVHIWLRMKSSEIYGMILKKNRTIFTPANNLVFPLMFVKHLRIGISGYTFSVMDWTSWLADMDSGQCVLIWTLWIREACTVVGDQLSPPQTAAGGLCLGRTLDSHKVPCLHMCYQLV